MRPYQALIFILIFSILFSCTTTPVVAQGTDRARAAVLERYPGVEILEIEEEKWRGQKVYEYEFVHEGVEVEVYVTPDGTIVDVEEQGRGGPLSRTFQGGLHEKDVRIPMRDGSHLVADVFRPDRKGQCPVIVTVGPHGKDRLPWRPGRSEGVVEVGPYTAFETPDPEWWIPKGYAHVRIDQRGLGKSPGAVDPLSSQEARDYFDAIEWAGTRAWSNGKVGLLGISYYAVNQWLVAAERPPHLAAIIPWEGFTDLYRDFAYHGGVPALSFMEAFYRQRILGNTNPETTRVEPLPELLAANPFDGPFYHERSPRLEDIEVPLLAVANWGSHGLHLRGTIEGFQRAGSKHKWLRIHGNPKFGDFYSEEGHRLQRAFFDYWLKGIDNGFLKRPPLQVAVRVDEDENRWRDEDSWPLRDTKWTRLYLDASESALREEPPTDSGAASWEGLGRKKRDCLRFTSDPFSRPAEITGPLAARLWVSSTEQDFDLFLAIRNLRPDGREVMMLGEEGRGPVTLGWLRVSHRDLDPERSTPHRPFHPHAQRRLLSSGEVVPVDVEIWPTSMVFAKGHRLQLEIRSTDTAGLGDILHRHPLAAGLHTVHTSGERSSHLLVPVVERR
ncbi:MAG: CocE/NonD family hydrolase [Thermodesulfobacteriota bacterium]|nr:CocE/NonD family hydrolase [Thermodesulfobacteriota bacterium]